MKRLLPKKCWLIATAAAVVALGLAFALLAPSSNSRSPVAGVGVSFLCYTNTSAQGRSAAFVLTNGCDSAIDYSPALAQVQTDGSWGLFHYPPEERRRESWLPTRRSSLPCKFPMPRFGACLWVCPFRQQGFMASESALAGF